MRMRFTKWNGTIITDEVRAAQIAGVNKIVGECIATAMELVHFRYGVLQGSLTMEEGGANEKNGRVSCLWGSFDVNYAFWQEVLPEPRGKPYLRPAADTHYPDLNAAITEAYQ